MLPFQDLMMIWSYVTDNIACEGRMSVSMSWISKSIGRCSMICTFPKSARTLYCCTYWCKSPATAVP
jgi:hypothetical protein